VVSFPILFFHETVDTTTIIKAILSFPPTSGRQKESFWEINVRCCFLKRLMQNGTGFFVFNIRENPCHPWLRTSALSAIPGKQVLQITPIRTPYILQKSRELAQQ
jgi:hypothetical protein